MGTYPTNQALNQAQSTPTLITPHPAVIITETSLGNRTISWQELGFEQVPSIGVHTSGVGVVHNTNKLEETASIDLVLSPNPVQDILTIKTKFIAETKAQYVVSDAMGRIIHLITKDAMLEDQQQLDVSKLAVGTYYVTVKTSTEELSESFIKR